MKSAFTILTFILISTYSIAQTCENSRYIDSLFDVDITYNIQYQTAKPYGSLINIPYQIDVYEPSSDTLIFRPIILFQFGGGYLIGDKLNPPAHDFCSYWAQRGYVSAAINYRLGFNTLVSESGERAVYRAIQDLQAALRFLVDEKNTYGIDTSNIIISGNSAGAISSMHNAFMDADQAPASSSGYGFGLDADDLGGPFSSGNTNFGNNEVVAHGYIACWGGMLDTNLVGDRPDDYVPIILFHGIDDDAVSYNSDHPFSFPAFPVLHGSNPLKTRMDNVGIISKLIPFEGAGHEPELLNPAYLDTILVESSVFIYNEVLRPKLISVTGDTSPLLNSTAIYSVVANEPLSHLCITLASGNIINQTTNNATVQWTVPGADTLIIVGINEILAADTIKLPIEINISSSIKDGHSSDHYRIFPNPCRDKIHIENTSNKPIDISIFSLDGKLLSKVSNCSEFTSISLKKFQTSLMLINCSNETFNSSQLIRIEF